LKQRLGTKFPYKHEILDLPAELCSVDDISFNKAGSILVKCHKTEAAGYPDITDRPDRNTAARCVVAKYMASNTVLAKYLSLSDSVYIGGDGTGKHCKYFRGTAIGGIIRQDIAGLSEENISATKVTFPDGTMYLFWETFLNVEDCTNDDAASTVASIITAMEEIADIQRSRNWRVTTNCDIDSIVSPDRYKNLISDGKCIVYDVIARMQNTNIRHPGMSKHIDTIGDIFA
jgi:hypothetical protein